MSETSVARSETGSPIASSVTTTYSCSGGSVIGGTPTVTSLPLDRLTKDHLHGLVDDAVIEGRALEYKQSVGSNDAAKREFLADVSSFANAAGGDLVVGVAENAGPPPLHLESTVRPPTRKSYGSRTSCATASTLASPACECARSP